MLRNTLLAFLAFRRFYSRKRKLSLLRFIPEKKEVSALVVLTERKYRKTSNEELIRILSEFPELIEIILFCIPRKLQIPYFRSVVDIMNYLLMDCYSFINTYINSEKAVQSFLPYLMDWIVSVVKTIPLRKRAKRSVT